MYGLNNNTGTTYTNSGNEITKLNKSSTNADKGKKNAETLENAINFMSGFNSFKNSDTGGGRLLSIAQMMSGFMK